jgi:acyl carrier protein phosphodiesterase
MNFLAHCSLAHDAAQTWQCDPEQRAGLLAGAVIGDFVKGQLPQAWPHALRAGARLHRKVDALSNINPGIRKNCDRYPAHLRRFAPIFVDMLADHCLALNWQNYYDMDPQVFSADCYGAIASYQEYLTPEANRFFTYMRDVDLLANYDEWSNVARGLKSVLRRLRRDHWFEEVEQASLATVPGTHADFTGYYPELQQAWTDWNAFTVTAAPRNL